MYSRPRCGLCDEAREVIMAERAGRRSTTGSWTSRGTTSSSSSTGSGSPVVLVDGQELFEIRVDADRFGGGGGRTFVRS